MKAFGLKTGESRLIISSMTGSPLSPTSFIMFSLPSVFTPVALVECTTVCLSHQPSLVPSPPPREGLDHSVLHSDQRCGHHRSLISGPTASLSNQNLQVNQIPR